MINNETHARFWVTLQRPYFELLSQDAQDHNLSTTAYAGQILSQYIENNHPGMVIKNETSNTPESLNETIIASLEEKDYGVQFTVKDLFDESKWESMNRSEKAISAKILAAIERNSDIIQIVDTQNKTSIYEKKEVK